LKAAQDGFYLLLFSDRSPSGHYDQFARRILRLLCIALSVSRKHRSG